MEATGASVGLGALAEGAGGGVVAPVLPLAVGSAPPAPLLPIMVTGTLLWLLGGRLCCCVLLSPLRAAEVDVWERNGGIALSYKLYSSLSFQLTSLSQMLLYF